MFFISIQPWNTLLTQALLNLRTLTLWHPLTLRVGLALSIRMNTCPLLLLLRPLSLNLMFAVPTSWTTFADTPAHVRYLALPWNHLLQQTQQNLIQRTHSTQHWSPPDYRMCQIQQLSFSIYPERCSHHWFLQLLSRWPYCLRLGHGSVPWWEIWWSFHHSWWDKASNRRSSFCPDMVQTCLRNTRPSRPFPTPYQHCQNGIVNLHACQSFFTG